LLRQLAGVAAQLGKLAGKCFALGELFAPQRQAFAELAEGGVGGQPVGQPRQLLFAATDAGGGVGGEGLGQGQCLGVAGGLRLLALAVVGLLLGKAGGGGAFQRLGVLPALVERQ
jgi:hypothetical protein